MFKVKKVQNVSFPELGVIIFKLRSQEFLSANQRRMCKKLHNFCKNIYRLTFEFGSHSGGLGMRWEKLVGSAWYLEKPLTSIYKIFGMPKDLATRSEIFAVTSHKIFFWCYIKCITAHVTASIAFQALTILQRKWFRKLLIWASGNLSIYQSDS